MSAVGTTPPPGATGTGTGPAAPAGQEAVRHCPHCGSALGPDQEWCLACGAATTTRVAAPRGWRIPLVAGGALLALAVAAALLAIITLARGPETVTPGPTATPAPTAAATAAPTVAAPAALADWPAGQRGWTVVLASPRDRAKAERTARRLQARGLQVGLLDADLHPPLPTGRWVVFSGTYPSRAGAEAALVATGAADSGASVQRVNR
jgi:glucose/arabinose dehydrogenase